LGKGTSQLLIHQPERAPWFVGKGPRAFPRCSCEPWLPGTEEKQSLASRVVPRRGTTKMTKQHKGTAHPAQTPLRCQQKAQPGCSPAACPVAHSTDTAVTAELVSLAPSLPSPLKSANHSTPARNYGAGMGNKAVSSFICRPLSWAVQGTAALRACGLTACFTGGETEAERLISGHQQGGAEPEREPRPY